MTTTTTTAKRARTLAWTLGLAALAGAALLPAHAATPAAQHPKLQGTWKLDEDLTNRMREEDRPQGGRMGGLHGGGMGRHGGGGPGGWGGRHGGDSPGGVPPEGGPGGGAPPDFTALDELTIAQTDGQVTVTDKAGHARTFKTDGSKVRDEKGPRGPAEVQANWEKDGTLTVRVRPDQGPQRTESYVVSNDGKHLYVILTMEGGGDRPQRKIRRAYAPA